MLKKLLENSLIYGLSKAFTRGVSLLLLPFYTRVFAPGDYGLIDLLNIAASLVSLTVALEISQGVARQYVDAADGDERSLYVSTGLGFTLAMNGLFVVGAWALAAPISRHVLDAPGATDVFRIAALSFMANGLFYFMQSQLRWQQKAKGYALASAVFTLVSVGCTFLAIVAFGAGVAGVFFGTLAGAIVGSAVAWCFARDSYRLAFDFAKLAEMLRFSGPLVPSSLAVFVTLYIDRIAIKEMLTLHDLGLYGVGYRFASVVGLLLIGFQASLTPLILERYRDPATPAALAKILRLFLVIAMALVLGLSVFASELLMVFTTPTYYPAASVIPLLALSLLISEMYIFAPGLSIARKTQLFPVINGAAAAANVGLTRTLIPRLGLLGAAIAMLASALLQFTLHMTFSQRHYFVPHRWGSIVAAICSAIGFALAGRALDATGGLPLAVVVSMKAGLYVSGLALLAWILIGKDDLRRWASRLSLANGLTLRPQGRQT